MWLFSCRLYLGEIPKEEEGAGKTGNMYLKSEEGRKGLGFVFLEPWGGSRKDWEKKPPIEGKNCMKAGTTVN